MMYSYTRTRTRNRIKSAVHLSNSLQPVDTVAVIADTKTPASVHIQPETAPFSGASPLLVIS